MSALARAQLATVFLFGFPYGRAVSRWTRGHPPCDNLEVSSPAVSAAPAWANRIVGSGEEAPDQLLANPANWRSIRRPSRRPSRRSSTQVGWVQQVLVNQRTGHVVDGHLRVAWPSPSGEPSVPVLYVDLSEDEERLVLASLDPLAAMATTDEAKLCELLADVSVDSEALAAMLAALAPAEPKDGLDRPRRRARAAGRGDHAAG